ncbi:MAG: peroxiredoxin [Candidatus Aenigmarchaeota archaeon]|nr:peroxiredoxin [Candidatus Aenigmarchaeota archaeon]
MEQEKINFPLIGDKAPSFKIQTTQGMINFPNDYKGKWVVLFSHPADFTPVCTTEFVSFQKRYEKFKKMNTELIGLSIDQVFSHMKWTEWINEKLKVKIEFPIIADDMGKVASLFGMVHPSKGTNTVRAVFVIDPRGVIRTILYYPQEAGRNMDEVLRIVKALQTVDGDKVATPANWPENELIKDRVIVPPAKDEETIKERRKQEKSGEIECYDWWLCHKKM